MLEQTITATLTPDERVLLTECEQTITEGLHTFYEVGIALKHIDELRLYRESNTDFDTYCRERWGFTGTHGYRQIKAATIIDEVSPLGDDLAHEKTVRPLSILVDPLEKRLAIQLAFAAAAVTVPSKRVTEAIMRQAVETVLEIKATQGSVDVDGTMHAAVSSVIVKHHQQVQNAIEEAEEKRNQKSGLVVTLLKRRKVRLISRSGRRVTLEFDSETDLDLLPFQETGIQLQVSLTKKYSGKTTNGLSDSK